MVANDRNDLGFARKTCLKHGNINKKNVITTGSIVPTSFGTAIGSERIALNFITKSHLDKNDCNVVFIYCLPINLL